MTTNSLPTDTEILDYTLGYILGWEISELGRDPLPSLLAYAEAMHLDLDGLVAQVEALPLPGSPRTQAEIRSVMLEALARCQDAQAA